MKFLSVKHVQQLVPFSKTQLLRMVKEGRFPGYFRPGARAAKRDPKNAKLFWLESDVLEWMQLELEARNQDNS